MMNLAGVRTDAPLGKHWILEVRDSTTPAQARIEGDDEADFAPHDGMFATPAPGKDSLTDLSFRQILT